MTDRRIALAALAALVALSPAAAVRSQPGEPQAAIKAALAAGYLGRSLPSSLSLIPAPPAAGSAAQARDDDAARAGAVLRGGPRWTQAAEDAELRFPKAPETFACAVGVEISPAATPKLYALLQRTEADLGLATYPTKTKYQRARPFTVNGRPICTPQDEKLLRGDGSYPSGHSTVGWGWALILTEAAPERANEILSRGRAFGQSRIVCNVHWQSDVDEGRVMAAAVVARLHAEAAFRADLEAARDEIAKARAAGAKPARDCAAEAANLAAGS